MLLLPWDGKRAPLHHLSFKLSPGPAPLTQVSTNAAAGTTTGTHAKYGFVPARGSQQPFQMTTAPSSFPSAVTPSLSTPRAHPKVWSHPMIKHHGAAVSSRGGRERGYMLFANTDPNPSSHLNHRNFGCPKPSSAPGTSTGVTLPGAELLAPTPLGKPRRRTHRLLFPGAADENRNAPLWMGCLGKCFSSKFHGRFEFFWRED